MHNPLELPVKAGLAGLATMLVACGDGPGDVVESEPDLPDAGTSFLPEHDAGSPACGEFGKLSATLVGALAGEIRWSGDSMSCEGMPRPGGEGARLRFAGNLGEQRQPIAFIIGLPALRPAATATELPSNVTVIEEGRGRFFSTPGLDSCWTDVMMQTALDETRYSIEGQLYCIAPLAEVNGESSVSISELTFAGQLDWSAE